MATTTAQPRHCKLGIHNAIVPRPDPVVPAQISFPKLKPADSDYRKGKIVLQPRLCTLRSYGSDRVRLMKTRIDNSDEVSRFFETLTDYIESSKKSHDFETISGRLAMIVFAVTVMIEIETGNSLFGKMEIEGIAEAGGIGLGAVSCAAVFAWFTIARIRVDRIFTGGCNMLIDSLIDRIVDGLFYEGDISDLIQRDFET